MGMKRKRQLSSVIFHAGACILGFFMIYPLLWLLASSFKSNETMFTNTYSLLPEVWDAAKNYASGFAGIGGVAFSTFFMNWPLIHFPDLNFGFPISGLAV